MIKLIERTTSLLHVYTVPVNAPHLNKNIIILITIFFTEVTAEITEDPLGAKLKLK